MNRTHVNNLIVGGILIPIGVAFALAGYYLVLKPELRVKKEFVETTCTVLDKRLVTGESGTGAERRTTYRPEFVIRYTVDGKPYDAATYDISHISSNSRSSNQAILDKFDVGKEYPCWYDPLKPEVAVLTREMSSLGWIFTGLGVVLAAIGMLVLLFYAGLILFFVVMPRGDDRPVQIPPVVEQ